MLFAIFPLFSVSLSPSTVRKESMLLSDRVLARKCPVFSADTRVSHSPGQLSSGHLLAEGCLSTGSSVVSCKLPGFSGSPLGVQSYMQTP